MSGDTEESDSETAKEILQFLVDNDMTMSELIEALMLCEKLKRKKFSPKATELLKKVKRGYVKYLEEIEI
jgi:hypothetical protein